MDRLTQALVEDLPHDFLVSLAAGGSQVYGEAWVRTYGDPLLGNSAEAHDLIGHERHALYQAHLARCASQAGLTCPALPNPAGTSFYRMLKSKRFLLTASAVQFPRERPRGARHRTQNAQINRLLPQTYLAFMEESKLHADPDAIYGIILHGPQTGNPREIGFATCAIPSADGRTWIHSEPIERLIQAQIQATNAAEQIVDLAQPRRRQRTQGE
jgi:hypothetical protein